MNNKLNPRIKIKRGETMASEYWSVTGFRLRLWMRLYFIISLLIPKGFKLEADLRATNSTEPEGMK